jgi:type II secretory pathway pseudopilin PulG
MFRWIDKGKSSNGFTLVEALVGMSIGLAGMAGGYALLANIQGTAAGNRVLVQAQQEARNIVEHIAREVRESNPDQVWTYSEQGWGYLYFRTPRDENNTFVRDPNGKPEWQRWIYYVLDSSSNCLYRYRFQESLVDQFVAGEVDYTDMFFYEVVSRNVERVYFEQSDDMITISVRAFAESDGKVGHVARSYADYSTMVRVRN